MRTRMQTSVPSSHLNWRSPGMPNCKFPIFFRFLIARVWPVRASDSICAGCHLSFSGFDAILRRVMKRRLARQFLALLFGIVVILGTSLSAVQAGDMAVKMATASGMDASGHGDCNGCNGSSAGDDGAKAMVCPPVCVAPGAGILPQIGPEMIVPISVTHSLPREARLVGSASAPDPYPPRPSDLG